MKPRHSLCLRDKDDTRPITARERQTELVRIGPSPWIAAAAVADLAESMQAQSCLPTVTCPRMTSLPAIFPAKMSTLLRRPKASTVELPALRCVTPIARLAQQHRLIAVVVSEHRSLPDVHKASR